MPVIKIDFIEGQINGEQKGELIEKITKSVCEIAKCSQEVVTIIINDVAKGNWGSVGKQTEKPLYHPIVSIDMLDGKTAEQKRALIEAITNDLCEISRCDRKGVVIIFHDISRDDWGSGGLPKSATVQK
ncbi:MAG: tautomerase family protein [Candidatus Gracilibacteria bacterium]|jgi:4-oxalocrotonate tautomerase